MAGTSSAYNQTQAFNKELYDPTGRGAGLDNPFKNQLSEQAARVAGAGGRKGRNQEVQSFHQMIWNNPNIPNELKQMLADYASYAPRVRPSGSGAAVKQAMGGDVMPPYQRPRPGSRAARNAPPPEKKPKQRKNKPKATVAVDSEPPQSVSPEPAKPERRRRMKGLEE